MEHKINDLRSAIALLQRHEGQYIETHHPVDPNAELAGFTATSARAARSNARPASARP